MASKISKESSSPNGHKYVGSCRAWGGVASAGCDVLNTVMAMIMLMLLIFYHNFETFEDARRLHTSVLLLMFTLRIDHSLV